ncbi:MAG: hypothetical protein HOP21_07190 [Methylotenera sp.]|nr:hypothetical protein [Methylotenera sp.]
MSNQFPVDLVHVYFTHTNIDSVPTYVADESNMSQLVPENKINVQRVEGSDNNYAVVMQTLLNPEKEATGPYRIDIECVAILRINSELSPEEALKAATITGHSVVYGAIRESVLWLTGRHAHGPLTLGLSVLSSKKPVELSN